MPNISLQLAALLARTKSLEAYTKKYNVRNLYDPKHYYNYLGAMDAGVVPVKWKSLPAADRKKDLIQVAKGQRKPIPPGSYMWPDEFKLAGHPVPPEQ